MSRLRREPVATLNGRLVGRMPVARMLAGALVVGVTVMTMGITVGSNPASAAPRVSTGKPWKVTLSAAKTSVNAGQKIKLSGHVAKAAAGLLVMLQEQSVPGKPWKDQRQARVHADGTFTTYDVPTTLKSRSYRVVMPKAGHRTRGISAPVRISIFQWRQLTSMPTVNESYLDPTSTVSLNGTPFPASLEATTYHPNGPTSQSVEFNLDHRCTMFRGTFGLSDDSEASSQASVTASADGTPWFSQVFSIGQATANAISFTTPPLKISFNTVSLVDGLDGFGAVGTPEVYCTQ